MENEEKELRRELGMQACSLQRIAVLLIAGILIAGALLKLPSLRYYSIVTGSLCLGPIAVIVLTTVMQLGKTGYAKDELQAYNRHMHVLNRVAVIVLYASFALLLAGMITAISIGL